MDMFIAFEGIDGCGKSTQVTRLAEWLGQQYRRKVLITREPGDWADGKALRQILLNGNIRTNAAEICLFFADRAEHLAQTVLPALQRGEIVISDRYRWSTLAYQTYGRGLSADLVKAMEEGFGIIPADHAILLDVDPEIAARRMAARGGDDRFERLGKDFMDRVRKGYLELAWEAGPSRATVIPGNRPPHLVFDEIQKRVPWKTLSACLQEGEVGRIA
jgi:dTMP kinase